MKKLVYFFVVVLFTVISCKKEYDLEPVAPSEHVQAVLSIDGGIKFSTAIGDTLIKNVAVIVDGRNSSGPIKSYAFNFGDGTGTDVINTGSVDSIFILYSWNEVGKYLVSLSVYSEMNGFGEESVATKTIWVVDSTTPPPPPPIENGTFILLDSIQTSTGWVGHFKLNVDSVFYAGVTEPFYYKGDQNNWSETVINGTLQDGWFYFDITVQNGAQGHRFTVVKNGSWAKFCPDINLNQNYNTIYASYGCIELYSDVNGIYPAYTPGQVGDQQISLEPLNNDIIRIYVKDVNFAWGTTPGISDLREDGWHTHTLVDFTNPYNRWSYYDIDSNWYKWSGNSQQGVCYFQLLPDISNPDVHYVWQWSYFYDHDDEYSVQTTSF